MALGEVRQIRGAAGTDESGEAQRALARALPGRTITAVEAIAGGVCNRIYRVRVAGSDEAFALRVYARDPGACAKEAALHGSIGGRVPVPEILYAQTAAEDGLPPFLLLRWAAGVTYRELKKRGTPDDMAQAAASMGAVLADIGSFSFERGGRIEAGLAIGAPLREGTDPEARFVEDCLDSPVLARRLELPLRRRVREFLWQWAPRLAALHRETRLVHADYGSPNLILDRRAGRWQVAAVLDWECAFSGAPLYDVAHALRYERWNRPRMEPHFSNAFREHGGELPEDWRGLGRAADLTALCECLTRAEFPEELAREIAGLIADSVA